MLRKLAGLLVVPLLALGLVVATPGAASADPTPMSQDCTATGTVEIPKFGFDHFGNPIVIGWTRWSYVGSFLWLTTTYRIWHVTSKSTSQSTYSYLDAYTAKCVGGVSQGEIDLTRTPAETITSPTDPACGSTNFSVGMWSYAYIGARLSSGDTFRYWRRYSNTPPLVSHGPYSARCA